ncbi:MAG: response regulator transcription factor [Granulosicoccaceae bacterium]
MTPKLEPDYRWNTALAKLIAHLHMRQFPTVLVETLSMLADFDSHLVATFKHDYRPLSLSSSYENEQRPPIGGYLDHSYLLDPLFNAIQDNRPSGVYRMHELEPDCFEETEFYRVHYLAFDLADEVIYICRVTADVTLTVSLGRSNKLGSIQRAQMNRLRQSNPVIQALCQQFWLNMASEFTHSHLQKSTLVQSLNSFTNGLLTEREQQVAGLILQGYSSKTIARELGISDGTVKVHRKHIHQKLGINSQSQLFSLFVAHLNSL